MNNNFWFGCVESRSDPLRLGRYKVRVVGIHTDDKSELPTDDLPWATCLQPTTSAAMSGVGSNPGLVNGSWVMVVFTNNDYQVPIILGSIAGIPGKVDEESNPDAITVPPVAEATPSEKIAGTKDGSYPEDVLYDGTPFLGTLTISQYKQLTAKIREIESSGKYTAVNELGYIGAYQFGAAALEDLGYIKKGSWAKYKKNKLVLDNNDNWTGKDGCSSKLLFLANVSAQDNCILLYSQRSYKLMLMKNQVGTTTDPRVLAGLLGAAHNQGTGCISKLLRGETTKDGNGTTAQSYYNKCYAAITIESGQATNTTPNANPEYPRPIPNEDELSPPSVEKTINKRAGFSDPEGKYPTVYNEADTNRLVRGQNISKTIVSIKDKERKKNVSIGLSEQSWDQPSIQYAAQYPYNHATISESGHVFELDDTMNAERVHLYHRSGSFVEIDQAGNQVNKIVGHGIEIIERDGYVSIKGNCHITVEGACTVNAASVYVESPIINVKSEKVRWDTDDFELKAAKKFSVEAESISLQSSKAFSTYSAETMSISSHSNIDVKSESIINIDGTQIHLNGGRAKMPNLEVIKDIVKFSGDIMNISAVSRSDAESSQLDEHPNAQVIAAGDIAESAPQTPVTSTDVIVPDPVAPINNSECPIFDLTLGDTLKLSPNFTVKSLCKDGAFKFSGQHSRSAQEILCNMSQLCHNVLEPLLVIYGKSLKINSCWRPSGNPLSKTGNPSQHELGQAVDIGFNDVAVDASGVGRKTEYFKRAQSILGKVPYDQFLFETQGATSVWIHISYTKDKNRRKIYTYVNHKKAVEDKIVLFT